MRPSVLFARPVIALSFAWIACSSETEITPPPPLPAVPAPVAPVAPAPVPAEPGDAPRPSPVEPAMPTAAGESPDKEHAPANKGVSLYDLEPKAKAGKSKPKERGPANAGEPYKPAGDPKPVLTEKPAEPKPFVAPDSPHVVLQLPSGLKNDLAHDTRMGPWLAKGVSAASRCYEKHAANTPGLSGAVTVGIVMHENDLPSAEIKSLDPALAGVFSCVTSAMMTVRMPLFTGKEGQRYTAVVRFSP